MKRKKQGFLHRQTKDVYDIPADLQGHLEQLETTPKKTWVEDYVFQNYIHHSHQYRAIPKRWAVVVFNSNAPKTNPKLAAPNGKREIFYNEIAKGYSSVDTWERKHVTRTGGIWKRK